MLDGWSCLVEVREESLEERECYVTLGWVVVAAAGKVRSDFIIFFYFDFIIIFLI